jgi:hypothetical protein
MASIGMPELLILFTIGLMGLAVVWPAVRILSSRGILRMAGCDCPPSRCERLADVVPGLGAVAGHEVVVVR